MKRVGILFCLIMLAVSMFAPASFADETAAAGKTSFSLESSTPGNGAEGVAVENLSVKLYFDTDMIPKSKSVEKANAKQFKLTGPKGKKIPIKVYYSDKEEGLMMVVSDNVNNDIQIQGDTKYTLTIGSKLQATDGSRLGSDQTITFRTLDQGKSTTIYMIMMVVMMVGMVYYTSKSAKKMAEKEKQESGKSDTVNPYKEAKRTGKSVEEIVEKDKQRKAKEAEARAKKKALEEELDRELEAKERAERNKRVSVRKPISAAGSEYKVKVVKTQPKQPEKKTNTNPKNKTGKQKNSQNKGKKKK